MSRPDRRAAAVVVAALLCVGAVFPGLARADTPTTTTTTTTPTTTSSVVASTTATAPETTTTSLNTPATSPPAATTTLAEPPPATTGPTATSTAPTSSTTVTPSTTTTTVDPTVLAALIRNIDLGLARAQAIDDYAAARSIADSPVPGRTVMTTADTALIDAAEAEVTAAAARDVAATGFAQARRRVSQVALTLYLGDQASSNLPTADTSGERSAMLTVILQDLKGQLDAARKEWARATAVFNRARADSDRLVNAQAAVLVADVAASAPPTPTVAPSSTTGTTVPTSSTTAVRPPRTLPPTIVAMSPTVLGPSTLTNDELAAWYRSTGRTPYLTVPIEALVGDFESLGASAGVRADIAFAQSMIETDYLNFPSYGQVAVMDNNFAGIGACDRCATGSHFPDAATGVAAQMQLLHAYAVKGPSPGPLTPPAWVSGCCPTWLGLSGVWASNLNYGFAILKTYRAMLDWVVARRSAAVGL